MGLPLALLPAEGIETDVMTAYQAATDLMRQSGAEVEEIEVPESVHWASDIYTVISMAEAYAFHEEMYRAHPGDYGPKFVSVLLNGAMYTASDYLHAQRGRMAICEAMGGVMGRVDLLALPTKSEAAPTFEAEAETGRHTWKRHTTVRRLFSLTGQPAISIPCGLSDGGMPVGLQLAGRLLGDHTVFSAAHAYERATPWHRRYPSL
jgi:aspartyl-tRNA(Asn)/glutamyl-tRNA(Gln) amidotransferase subunit A